MTRTQPFEVVCPACLGYVEQDDAGQVLACRQCGLGYRVRNGVPYMLLDEAVRL